jgi:hypothetical protein
MMTDALLSLLDAAQRCLWRIGVRFQWPCWLLSYAWDRRARLDCPADPQTPAPRAPEKE